MTVEQKKTNFEPIIICKTFMSQLKGCMFNKTNKYKNFAYIFSFNKPSTKGIHTWFCKYTIQALFISEKKEIIDRVILEPYKTYTPKRPYSTIIEINPQYNYHKWHIGDSVKEISLKSK